MLVEGSDTQATELSEALMGVMVPFSQLWARCERAEAGAHLLGHPGLVQGPASQLVGTEVTAESRKGAAASVRGSCGGTAEAWRGRHGALLSWQCSYLVFKHAFVVYKTWTNSFYSARNIFYQIHSFVAGMFLCPGSWSHGRGSPLPRAVPALLNSVFW